MTTTFIQHPLSTLENLFPIYVLFGDGSGHVR